MEHAQWICAVLACVACYLHLIDIKTWVRPTFEVICMITQLFTISR